MEPSKALKNIKRLFKKAAIGIAAVFATAAAVEFTGYHAFDQETGDNLLCEMDPNCRSLTQGEIALSKEVFGDAIDYTKVKIFDRPWFGIGRNIFEIDSKGKSPLLYAAISPNGNIYIPLEYYQKDFSESKLFDQGLFFHEMAHVYQNQSGRDLVALALQGNSDNNYSKMYDYNLDEVTDFAALNIEQQAHLVQDYYAFYARYNAEPTRARKSILAQFQEVLAPYLETVCDHQDKLSRDSEEQKKPAPATFHPRR